MLLCRMRSQGHNRAISHGGTLSVHWAKNLTATSRMELTFPLHSGSRTRHRGGSRFKEMSQMPLQRKQGHHHRNIIRLRHNFQVRRAWQWTRGHSRARSSRAGAQHSLHRHGMPLLGGSRSDLAALPVVLASRPCRSARFQRSPLPSLLLRTTPSALWRNALPALEEAWRPPRRVLPHHRMHLLQEPPLSASLNR
jgi:hypothetical protein